MKTNRLVLMMIICSITTTGFLIVPPVSAITVEDASITPSLFSPDGNGLNDSIAIRFDSTSGQSLYLNIFYNTTQLIRSDLSLSENPSGTYRTTWNGKNDNETLVTEEGTYTIRVSDTLGGGGGTIVGTATVDLTAPSSPSLSIDGGSSATTSRNVNLTISATGATKIKVSNFANFTGATWETYSTSKQWQLTSGDGTKTVYINFRDSAGTNTSTSDSITLDTNLSTPSLSINSGDSATNNLTVTLSITASDATGMKVDNNTDFNNMSSWISKTSTYTFTLPIGADGTRTVYLRVKDDAGNVKTTSDSITVDRTAPTNLQFSINDDASYTNNQTVSLSISASGSPQTIWLSNTGSSYQSMDYSTTVSWNLSTGDGAKTVYCKVSDAAGNNASTSASITLDTINPSAVTLDSPSTAETLTSQEPTFSWSNPNQQSQTRQFTIQILQTGTVKQSSTTNASTTSYTADTLAEGTYSWKVTVYDMANNSATTSQQSFTISIDGLAIPPPTYPTASAHVNDTTPRLRWSQVSGQGTVYYDYKYGNSSQNLTNTGSTTNLYIDTITYEHGEEIYWAVRARNTSTQSNYSQVRSLIVDTQEPIIHSITLSSDERFTTSQSVTVALNITGASWIKLSEDDTFTDASWTTYSSTKSFSLSSGDGVKKVYVIAKDNAVGDQGSTAYANINDTTMNDTIILDTGAPTLTNPIPSNGGSTTTTSNLPIQLSYTDEGTGVKTENVYITVDETNVTASATITAAKVSYVLTTVSTGLHTVNVTVWDNASHPSYYNWTFTVSTSGNEEDDPSDGGSIAPPSDSAPTISNIIYSPTTITSSDTITITATVNDDSSLASVDVYFNDGTLDSKAMTLESGSSRYTATIGPFESGKNVTFYIVAIDDAPQTSTSSEYSFTIEDNQEPTITVISPTQHTIISEVMPIILATYSDNGGIDTNQITLHLDGQEITSQAIISSSEIKYIPTDSLTYGNHTVTLTVTDNNENIATVSWTFTIKAETTKISETINQIQAGEEKIISLTSYDTVLQQIDLITSETMEDISLSITTTMDQPAMLSTPDNTVYLYLIIETNATIDAISGATIHFRVEKSWFNSSNISKNSITLLHYTNDTWQKLTTTQTDIDSTYVYYEAVTTGFSTFAITGEPIIEPTNAFPWIYLTIGIIAIAAGAAMVFIIIRRRN